MLATVAKRVMTPQQVRAAALLSAAVFCSAERSTSTHEMLAIAKELERYIKGLEPYIDTGSNDDDVPF